MSRAQVESTSAATQSFHVPALDCPEELALIERGLRSREGLVGVRPDFLRRTLHVEYEPELLAPEGIAQAIRQIGFEVEFRQREDLPKSPWGRNARLLPLMLAGTLLVLAAGLWFVQRETTVMVAVLTVASTVVSGYRVAQAGWRAVRLRALDMNALMTIAATGALLTGDYFEAATAMFLFGVSLMLESLSLDRARRAVQSLIELAPSVAHRLDDGNTVDVAATELRAGDRLLVKPGEGVPVDGVVESGRSAVNQAPITGESVPVEKEPGGEVFAGSLNGYGALVVRAKQGADDSVLAQIRRLVEQAQASRSPTERFVDRFARRYTPAVILLAIGLAVVPPLLGSWGLWPLVWGAHDGWAWLHRGLVLLVIACPCALVISTPITIVCGLYQAARRGVVIKGGEHLENAARIDHLVFDKTGTLTMGAPQLVRVWTSEGQNDELVLRIAASLEQQSAHPLAAGIVRAAAERQIGLVEVQQFVSVEGAGIAGEIDGTRYFAGSRRFFEEEGLPLGSMEEADGNDGAMRIFIGTREKLLGRLVLADQPRPDAQAALAQLRGSGRYRMTMLTGDTWTVAKQTAAELGVDDVQAEMMPQQKLNVVRDLTERRAALAMIGDGVNDAPALAAATLGIAMGSGASATALETADVVIMSPSLGRVPELFDLGRRCRRLLRQNIALALTVKAVVLVLAAVGMATMWMAVAADVGASMVVIFNGMRLIGYGATDSAAKSGMREVEPVQA